MIFKKFFFILFIAILLSEFQEKSFILLFILHLIYFISTFNPF